MAQGTNNTKTAKKTKEFPDCFFQSLYFQEENKSIHNYFYMKISFSQTEFVIFPLI